MCGGRWIVLQDTRHLGAEHIWSQIRGMLRAEVQGKAKASEEQFSHQSYPRSNSGDRTHMWVPKAGVPTLLTLRTL